MMDARVTDADHADHADHAAEDHATEDHAVVIAGSGPTGLMLAGELALAGIDVLIVEPRPNQDIDGSRAGGLHARTLEVLDQRGIADRFLAEGQVMQVQGFAGIPLDISDFPTRYNHGLALWQSRIEPLLAEWVVELGVPILRGRSVVAFSQDDAGVDVALSDGTTQRAAYLVGCDGGRSLVRKTAGIDFPGLDASTSWMIAQVDLDEPQVGMRPEGGGIGPVNRDGTPGPFGVVLKEPLDPNADDPTLADLRQALTAAYGTDFGARNPRWISRFTDLCRQAAASTPAYRTRSTWAGSWPRWWTGGHRTASSTPTTPNDTRSGPGSCTTPRPRWRSARPTTATRPSGTP